MRVTWTDNRGVETSADLTRRGIRLIGFANPNTLRLMVASTGEFIDIPPGGWLEIGAVEPKRDVA